MAHFRFDLARLRTPVHCEPGFSDALTRVAPSSAPGAGYGLFSVVALAGQIPLYEYTGTPVTSEQADKYPNAYMFSSDLYGVLDASRGVCSPAKFVNTKGRLLAQNNCKFVTREGHIFLSTTREIAEGEELFAPYGKQTLPRWPMTFLGCAWAEKIEFVRYLQNTPTTASRGHIQTAQQLLQGALDAVQQELVELRVQSATNFSYVEIVIKHEKLTKRRLQHAHAGIQKLTKLRAKTKVKLLKSNSQLEESKDSLKTTGAQLEDSQTQFASTRLQLEESKRQLQGTGAQLKDSQAQLASTRSQHEETKGQLQGTGAQLEDFKIKLASTHSQLKQVTGQLMLTTSQLETTSFRLNHSRSQTQQLQAQLQTVTVQLKEANEVIRHKGRVETKLKSAETDAQQLTKQESNTRRKLQHTHAQLDSVRAQLSTTNGQLQAADAKARTFLYQLREARIQLQTARDVTSLQLEEIRAAASAKVQQAKADAETQLRKAVEDADALLQETKAELEAEVEARDVQLETVKYSQLECESRWKIANTELHQTVQRVRNRMYQMTDQVADCVWKVSGESQAHSLLTQLYDDIMKKTAV